MDEERRVTEVRETNAADDRGAVRRQSVSTAGVASGGIVAKRFIWFVAGVIIAFIALRILFLLLGANQGNAFVDFVYGVGGLFAAPFYGIFSYQPSYGVSTFEVSSLVAIIIYALIAWGLGRLVTLSRPTTAV